MIEIPESRTVAVQIDRTLASRTITGVYNATHPHKFTWYAGDPHLYPELLTGKRILSAGGYGTFIDLRLEEEMHLAVSDGVNLRYHAPGAEVPAKYQLLVTLDNEGFLSLTVSMYGGIQVFRGSLDNAYYRGAVSKPSPLDDGFSPDYFGGLLCEANPNLSAKAFLATGQRIPGLGNGVLQDILFLAGIHPKRRIATLDDRLRERLYRTVRTTLAAMTAEGGRDTERDLFGHPGGYRVLLSRNTLEAPCPRCGGRIVRASYLGGAVYFCPCCQPLSE